MVKKDNLPRLEQAIQALTDAPYEIRYNRDKNCVKFTFTGTSKKTVVCSLRTTEPRAFKNMRRDLKNALAEINLLKSSEQKD